MMNEKEMMMATIFDILTDIPILLIVWVGIPYMYISVFLFLYGFGFCGMNQDLNPVEYDVRLFKPILLKVFPKFKHKFKSLAEMPNILKPGVFFGLGLFFSGGFDRALFFLHSSDIKLEINMAASVILTLWVMLHAQKIIPNHDY